MILNAENKYIALDIGHVLVRVDLSIFRRELVILNCCNTDEEAHCFNETVQQSLDLGIFDIRQAVCTYFPKINKKHADRLVEAWLATVMPCKPTLNVLSQLIAEKANVFLLSNIGKDHADYLSD